MMCCALSRTSSSQISVVRGTWVPVVTVAAFGAGSVSLRILLNAGGFQARSSQRSLSRSVQCSTTVSPWHHARVGAKTFHHLSGLVVSPFGQRVKALSAEVSDAVFWGNAVSALVLRVRLRGKSLEDVRKQVRDHRGGHMLDQALVSRLTTHEVRRGLMEGEDRGSAVCFVREEPFLEPGE